MTALDTQVVLMLAVFAALFLVWKVGRWLDAKTTHEFARARRTLIEAGCEDPDPEDLPL